MLKKSKNMVTVATLYKFVEINDKIDLQKDILTSCEKYNVKGTILLANEGINGTISAQKFEITKVINSLTKDKRFEDLEIKYSLTDEQPFGAFPNWTVFKFEQDSQRCPQWNGWAMQMAMH